MSCVGKFVTHFQSIDSPGVLSRFIMYFSVGPNGAGK